MLKLLWPGLNDHNLIRPLGATCNIHAEIMVIALCLCAVQFDNGKTKDRYVWMWIDNSTGQQYKTEAQLLVSLNGLSMNGTKHAIVHLFKGGRKKSIQYLWPMCSASNFPNATIGGLFGLTACKGALHAISLLPASLHPAIHHSWRCLIWCDLFKTPRYATPHFLSNPEFRDIGSEAHEPREWEFSVL